MSCWIVTLSDGSNVAIEASCGVDAIMKVKVLETRYGKGLLAVAAETLEEHHERMEMRTFETGATRDSDENKPDYEGYFSPKVLEAYGAYMLRHQKQADDKMRASDNWKKGIPRSAYIKSMFRHFVDVLKFHAHGPHTVPVVFLDKGQVVAGQDSRPDTAEMREALCALLFNVMGYLHELEEGR